MRLRHKLWLVFLGLMAALHGWVIHHHPLNKLVFREGRRVFFDEGGTEADTHVDRLHAYRALVDCEGGLLTCLGEGMAAADRHHPALPGVSSALWNLVVGPEVVPTLWLNFGWLLVLCASLYCLARDIGGPRAGELTVLLAVACPVIIGPSHLLHADLPMQAMLGLFAWGVHRYARGLGWGVLPIAFVAAIGAILAKWEVSIAVLGGLAGASVLSLAMPGGWRRVPVLVMLFYGVETVLEAYTRLAPSSFSERSELHWLLMRNPMDLLAYVRQMGGASSGTGGGGSLAGSKAAFYLQAMPWMAVGLLVTVLLMVGLVALLRTGQRGGRLLLFAAPWVGFSLAVLCVVVGFVDARFVYLFLTPLLVCGGVGLASLPWPRVVLGCVALVTVLQVWDMSLGPSPLSARVLARVPSAPALTGEQSMPLRLRPELPIGHGTWIRPEHRTPTDTSAVRAALALVPEGAAQLMLSNQCRGVCADVTVWEMELLLEGRTLQVEVPGARRWSKSGPYPRRCSSGRSGVLKEQLRPGTVLVVEGVGEVDWSVETCGTHNTAPRPPRILGEVLTASGGILQLLQL
jgi:hypothetical protein